MKKYRQPRYEALESCLRQLATQVLVMDASIHMRRTGCGLAGGAWARVEAVIQEILTGCDLVVYVYDF